MSASESGNVFEKGIHTHDAEGKMQQGVKAMNCEMQCGSACCFGSKETLLVWGYGKMIIAVFMLITIIIPGEEEVGIYLLFEKSPTQLAGCLIYISLTATWIIDLVFDLLLVAGAHLGKVKFLQAYYIYTNVLWVLIPLLGFVYYMIQANNLLYLVDMWRQGLRFKTLINICTMFATLVVQTFLLMALSREIVKINTEGSFNIGIPSINIKKRAIVIGFSCIKIEKPSANKKEKGQNNDEEKIETTCDKAMLIE